MKTRLIVPMIALLSVACGGDEKEGSAQPQTQYEVVQEGAAPGVTSTLPGTVPPMTGTSQDTTTAFTLNPAAAGIAATPGTIAGTLPSEPYGTTYPAGAPRVITPPRQARPSTPSVAQRQPAPEPAPATPEPTTTADSTFTRVTPPPAAEPKKTEEEPVEEEVDEPEQTETSAPPPPPPGSR